LFTLGPARYIRYLGTDLVEIGTLLAVFRQGR
jgi:hypothetical protein